MKCFRWFAGLVVLTLALSACVAFTPPESIATYDLKNIVKDAVLICYNGEKEVAAHFFGGRERDAAFVQTKTDTIAVFRYPNKPEEAFLKQNGGWRKVTDEELDNAMFKDIRTTIDHCFKRIGM